MGECLRIMALDTYARTYHAVMAPGSRVNGNDLPFARELEANLKAQMRGEL